MEFNCLLCLIQSIVSNRSGGSRLFTVVSDEFTYFELILDSSTTILVIGVIIKKVELENSQPYSPGHKYTVTHIFTHKSITSTSWALLFENMMRKALLHTSHVLTSPFYELVA